MKTIFAIAALSLAVLTAPAFADTAPTSGATFTQQHGSAFAANNAAYGPGEGRRFSDGIG